MERKVSITAIFSFCVFLFFSSPAEADALAFGPEGAKVCSFVIEGEISTETFEDFKEDIESIRDPNTCEKSEYGRPAYEFFDQVILMASPGGDLGAAFGIMQLIRKFDLNTHIDVSISGAYSCLSSCALIFASGINRHLTKDLKRITSENRHIGIHKPDFVFGTYEFVKQEKEYDRIKYQLMEFLTQGGVDPRYTISMFETANADLFFPPLNDLLIWRVVTSLDAPAGMKHLMN